MIEQQAVVTQHDDKTVWLKAERQSTCSACQIKKGCGTGLLADHVGKRFSQIAVEKTSDVSVGQQVKLAVPEQALLQGAMLMYLFPLALLFLFSAVTRMLNLNELVEIFAGFGGLLIGFYLVRIQLRNRNNAIQAKIVN